MTWLIYDGSLVGLLSSIFAIYERRLGNVRICKAGVFQPDAFAEVIIVESEPVKAKRVWSGMKKRLSAKGLGWFYYTWLSELPDMENALTAFARKVFASNNNIENNFGDPAVLKLSDTAKKVGREKHRMEAFVRFRQTKENIYYATVEPDFNVLPLIAPHFKNRYADQHWLIYDIRRKYGIYYNADTYQVSEVTIDWKEGIKPGKEAGVVFTPEESKYQELWQDYFKSTGIAERKNMRLHIQHVPRRYWKHLTEKTA